MESSSTPPPPPKSSQPLHNFDLPQLKWNMLSQSCSKKRSRSLKSPRGRHATSPPKQMPVLESALVKAPPIQSPPPQNSPVTPCHVSASKALPSGEESMNSRPGGEEPVRPFRKRRWVWQSAIGNDGTVIERNPVPPKINSDVNATDPLTFEKGEKKTKAAEEEGGAVRRSKILIKIPNIKPKKEEAAPEMGKSKEGVAVKKRGNNGEHEAGGEVQDKGKVSGARFDNETKISEFRKRKLVKLKSHKLANSGGEKSSILRVAEKNEGQAVVMKINANKLGVMGGGEKKEMAGGLSGKEKKFNGSGPVKEKEKDVLMSGGKKDKAGGFNGGDKQIVGGSKKEEKIGGFNGGRKEKLGRDEKEEEGEGSNYNEIKKKEKVGFSSDGEKKENNGENSNGKQVKKNGGGGDKKKGGGEGSNGGDETNKGGKAGGSCNSKVVKGKSGGNGSTEKNKGKGVVGSSEDEKKELSLSVSLTKDEIEEDIYTLTGSKPARRPKRRSKTVQKNLDAVFPGLWLLSITPETYKLSD